MSITRRPGKLPKSRRLSGLKSAKVQIWDTAAGNLVSHIGSSGERIAFSGDGNRIAIRSPYGVVEIWNIVEQRVVLRLNGSRTVLSPNGKWIATDYGDEHIGIWDSKTGRRLLNVVWPDSSTYSTMHCPLPRRIWFSNDGLRIAATFHSGIDVWNATTGRSLLTLRSTDQRSRDNLDQTLTWSLKHVPSFRPNS